MGDIHEPIILEPAGFTSEQGWSDCKQFVDDCGGLTDRGGRVNWRAAFGADPGCCSCPACKAMHWAWGTRVRCSQCGFEFETDWWPMYSYGVNEAKRRDRGWAFTSIEAIAGLRRLHEQRMPHPYYRYGYEHPVEDAYKERDKINWREIINAV